MAIGIFRLWGILGLVTMLQSLPRLESRGLRRVHRQVPARIPYASLSTGAIPSRLRNRLRADRPASSSSGSSSSGVSDGSTSGGPGVSSSSASDPYGRIPSSYPYRTGQGVYSQGGVQSFGQPQYGQVNGPVPAGDSTFPYGTGQYTGTYQNPYSSQSLPMPSLGGGGRGSSSQYSFQPQQPYGYSPQMQPQYNPYAGYGGGGYGGGNVPYGGNAYGMGVPQTQYVNPYGGRPQGTGGYYGGYSGGRYSYSPSGAAIGSPYRDPNSPYTSYVHPNADSGSSSYGSSGSYGGGSSYYGSSSYRGGSNPYGSGSSQTGYSRGGGSRGSSYGSSAGSTSQYGQSQPSVSSGRYSSSGSFGYSGQYGAGGDDSNPYGSYGGGSYAGSTSYGQPSGSRYGSVSNSRGSTAGTSYGRGAGSRDGGSVSDRRYGSYGQDSGVRQYGADGQSPYQNYGASPSDVGAGAGGTGQTGRYHNPASPVASVGAGSSPSYSHYDRGGQYDPTSRNREDGNSVSGTFYNPGTGPSDPQSPNPGSSSIGGYSPQYQPGTFYNPSAVTPRPFQSEPENAYAGNSTTSRLGIHRAQSDSPIVVEMREPTGPREDYEDQSGTFLVPRRGGNGRPKKPGRGRNHPALRKCERLDDGLPDLYVDHLKMKSSVFMQLKSRSDLLCALNETCLPASAYPVNAIYPRKLLRFATIVHNKGTADFIPAAYPEDWKYHSCHKHYHSMKEFAHFHLIHPNGNVVGEGHKVSFCLEDSGCKNPCKKTYDCERKVQGISPGCYDSYLASRDCQWVDVTHVRPGKYILRVTVNPLVNGDREVAELSYTNNIAECEVTIAMTSAEANKCWQK